MTLIPPSEVRDVSSVNAAEKDRIRDFLQGAVYCWCKNRPDEWFSLRDLMGGDNFYWQGTPMLPLYDYYFGNGRTSEQSVDQAGKDGGWLLKRVITDDQRNFETREQHQIREYHWLRPA
jgi:hypothetical protein